MQLIFNNFNCLVFFQVILRDLMLLASLQEILNETQINIY